MSSNAQRKVDLFLGAMPKVPEAIAAASLVIKTAVKADAAPRRPFSIFVPGDEELAAELASRMSDEARAMAGASESEVVERVMAVAAKAASGLPRGTAEYALKLFITHNPAARNLRIPNLMSRMLPSQMSQAVALTNKSGDDILSEIGGRSTSEEENRLAWFREDPLANEHHEHWHLVYPLSETRDRAIVRRRGEMFFYMHQQMLARFDAERLAEKIGRIEAYDDYRKPITVGYDVGELQIDRKKFPKRPEKSEWKDLPLVELYGSGDTRTYRIEDHEARRDRFREAAAKGLLHDPAGAPVPLKGSEGTNILGNTNECSLATVSVAAGNPRNDPRDGLTYYGNHHGFGHILVSSIGKTAEDWAVMFDPAANIRDPFFWSWHKHVDDISFAYQETLEPHTFKDAPPVVFGGGDDQGIVLVETGATFDALPRDDIGGHRTSFDSFMRTALGKERFSDDASATTVPFTLQLADGEAIDAKIDTVAELITEMRQGVFELFDPDFDGKRFRYPYLWHRPFHYALRLRSLSERQQTFTVRLYLCPAGDADGNPDDSLLEDRRLWIEMDKFTHVLCPGEDKIVVRADRDSSVIRRPAIEPEHVTDAHYPLGPPHEELGFCECGWPYHLLLPRGSKTGMRFALLAIVTKDELPNQGGCGSMSFCGVKNEYPDPRPMGYPFDRPLAKPLLELVKDQPSFALRFITIRYQA